MTDCSVKLPSSELSSHRADFPRKECSMVRTMAGVLLAPLPSLALFTCLLPPSGTHPSVTFRRTAARQQTPFKQQQLQGRTLIPTKCQKTAGFETRIRGEMKADIHKWRDKQFPWPRRLNMVVSIHSQTIYRFITIPIQVPTAFL